MPNYNRIYSSENSFLSYTQDDPVPLLRFWPPGLPGSAGIHRVVPDNQITIQVFQASCSLYLFTMYLITEQYLFLSDLERFLSVPG